jgi:hypothetical protein
MAKDEPGLRFERQLRGKTSVLNTTYDLGNDGFGSPGETRYRPSYGALFLGGKCLAWAIGCYSEGVVKHQSPMLK